MVKTKFIGNSDNINTPTYITPWSYIHFLTGLNIFLVLKYIKVIPDIYNLIILFILHTIYECNDYINTYILYDKYKRNTLVNSIGDTIFALLGWILGYVLFPRIKYKYIIILIILQIVSVIIFIKGEFEIY